LCPQYKDEVKNEVISNIDVKKVDPKITKKNVKLGVFVRTTKSKKQFNQKIRNV